MKFTRNLILVLAIVAPSFLTAENILKFNRLQNTGEKPIVLVMASYNNAQWYKWNLNSVFAQKYNNYHVIYIDDCSTDNTYELVKNYVIEKNMQDKVTLIHNAVNRKAMANQYRAIMMCQDTDIIGILDGDDALAHDQVLQYLNKTYADENVWMTYGQWLAVPDRFIGQCVQVPKDVIETKGALRTFEYVQAHMRTYYAGLFKQIKVEDLMYEGQFLPLASDIATMIPMHEMAQHHCKFIPDILYLYNMQNSLSEFRVNKSLEQKFDKEITRKRAPYDPVKSLFGK